jgi:hypothetical protein
MKPDEFEQKLARQPMKPIPAAWRAGILAAVEAEVGQRQVSREFTFAATDPSWLAMLKQQLIALLWPHPRAWAALAAVWILVFALHFWLRDPAPALAAKAPPPSPEAVAELRLQQRMLAELIGPAELRVANRQRDLSPKPRSECVETVPV